MIDEGPVIATGPAESLPQVSLGESFATWCKVAALSFGGPAGQIAVMHRILVEEKKWISEDRFLHALNYCMLLPGPEAQQLATYIGWLMHRGLGGLMAGILFILPGIVSILALSILYASYEQTTLIQALFFGLKPAVLAIVFEAVLRIGKRVLKNSVMVAIAAASFVAILVFDVPFPYLILAAGMIGFVGGRIAPARFVVVQSRTSGNSGVIKQVAPSGWSPAAAGLESRGMLIRRSLFVGFVCLLLWFSPIAIVGLTLGPSSVFWQESLFFSKAAVVTFGGAYSVLAYIGQQAVEEYGWLRTGEMMDGLGMAETTPGPLIMVVQFVGFMGAFRNPGPFEPLTAGIIGSFLTTWVTFVPCFLWVFLGAPFVERLRGNRLLAAALSSITAAVVGVILNLAIWFSMHTLFREVATRHTMGLRLLIPNFETIQLASCLIALVALLLTFGWKRGMLVTLASCVALGAAIYLFP